MVQELTSIRDPPKYQKADIVDLYSHLEEIEHRFREMKQHLLNNELTLRSRKPDQMEQELWGVVLAYNLLRSMMAQMAYNLRQQHGIGCDAACKGKKVGNKLPRNKSSGRRTTGRFM